MFSYPAWSAAFYTNCLESGSSLKKFKILLPFGQKNSCFPTFFVPKPQFVFLPDTSSDSQVTTVRQMSTWLCVHQLGSCPPKQFSPEASQVHWGQNASQVGDPAGALLACETCGCETCTTWLCLVSCEDLLCSGESRLHKQNGAKIL